MVRDEATCSYKSMNTSVLDSHLDLIKYSRHSSALQGNIKVRMYIQVKASIYVSIQGKVEYSVTNA